MSRKRKPGEGREALAHNKTWLANALSEDEAKRIIWHSPHDPTSSQVFCISVFGTLRSLATWQAAMDFLSSPILSGRQRAADWEQPHFEHTDRIALGETGDNSMPTSVDVYCRGHDAVICIESKFFHDANSGFGGCSQAPKNCEGHYGPGSDRKTGQSEAHCRLTITDGRRQPRRYFEIGRGSFAETVYAPQARGQTCPFRGPNYQLMRNFVLAKATAQPGQSAGVLAIVPKACSGTVTQQLEGFRKSVLRPDVATSVGMRTYDELADWLEQTGDGASAALAAFIRERINTICIGAAYGAPRVQPAA